MSILIKGMEMPKSCKRCEFFTPCQNGLVMIGPLGYCDRLEEEVFYLEQRREDCPLMPVPEHGRLIDTDAYRAEMKKRQDACAEWRDKIKSGGGYGTELFYRAEGFLGAMCEAKLTLDKMPTIIPADKEGER